MLEKAACRALFSAKIEFLAIVIISFYILHYKYITCTNIYIFITILYRLFLVK